MNSSLNFILPACKQDRKPNLVFINHAPSARVRACALRVMRARAHLLLLCRKNKNAVNHRCPSVRDTGSPRHIAGGI